MKFCNQCGASVELRIPPGDSLERHVCRACGTIHYINPKLVIGCVVEWEGDILLCRRAIEPCSGLWTLPAGFMEVGESTRQAARRETLEEACARITIDDLFALINIPHIDQVHIFYRGRLLEAEFAAGAESLETALFGEADIPWQALAFRSVALCLTSYFADRRRGHFTVHEEDMLPPASDHPRG